MLHILSGCQEPPPDPGRNTQYNAYVYSANNPTTWSDPSGLAWTPGPSHDPDRPQGTTIAVPVRKPQANRGPAEGADSGYDDSASDVGVVGGGSGGNWTDKVGKIAREWRISADEVRDAIHEIKRDGGYGGARSNPDVEVDVESGDVRIKGGDGEEVIGNLDDVLSVGEEGIYQPKIDWKAVGGLLVVIVGGIVVVLNPVNAATA